MFHRPGQKNPSRFSPFDFPQNVGPVFRRATAGDVECEVRYLALDRGCGTNQACHVLQAMMAQMERGHHARRGFARRDDRVGRCRARQQDRRSPAPSKATFKQIQRPRSKWKNHRRAMKKAPEKTPKIGPGGKDSAISIALHRQRERQAESIGDPCSNDSFDSKLVPLNKHWRDPPPHHIARYPVGQAIKQRAMIEAERRRAIAKRANASFDPAELDLKHRRKRRARHAAGKGSGTGGSAIDGIDNVIEAVRRERDQIRDHRGLGGRYRIGNIGRYVENIRAHAERGGRCSRASRALR